MEGGRRRLLGSREDRGAAGGDGGSGGGADLVASLSLPRIQLLCSIWDISVSNDIHKDHQHRARNGSL